MKVESINTVDKQSPVVNEKAANKRQDFNIEQIGNELFEQVISENEVIKSIESANEKIQIYNTRLQFSIHEKTKEIMVKIVNMENNEVIKEIPPEKILDMVAKLWELAGIIVDEKV
jgi:flagellar protein FlaG